MIKLIYCTALALSTMWTRKYKLIVIQRNPITKNKHTNSDVYKNYKQGKCGIAQAHNTKETFSCSIYPPRKDRD